MIIVFGIKTSAAVMIVFSSLCSLYVEHFAYKLIHSDSESS